MTVTNEECNKDNVNVSETLGKAINQRVSRSSFEASLRIDDRKKFKFVKRKVTIMSLHSPFRVSKKKLKPWTRKVNSRSFIALTLKSLTRRRDLSTVLLVICPSSKRDCHRIHIYSSRSQKHLGSAKVTIEETDLLERHRSPDNYSMAYCSLPLTLQDAARNSVIKKQIFDLARDQSQISRHLLYQGKPLCISHKSTSFFLNHKSDDQYKMEDFKNQSNSINSKTLAKRFLFLESQDKKEQKKALQSRLIIKEKKSQLRLLARKIHQGCYRESAAEPVKRLSERKKSRHTSPPLAPGSGSSSQTVISGTDDAQAALGIQKEQTTKKEQDRIQPTCVKCPRRLSCMRYSALIADIVPKNRSEESRSKQDSQQTLPESPRRFTSTQMTTRLCKPITNEFPKDKREDRRSAQKRIPQTMPKSPRRLPPTRYTALAEDKTDKLKKKRDELKRKKQEQNQRALVFSPTRNSALSKRVAEEDDPNKQDEDWRNVQEESQQEWSQLKNDEAQRNPEENSSLKEVRISQPLPKSPRRLPSIRNYSMRQTKLKKKRKEDKRKPQEQNQRALAISPIRNSILPEQVAETASLNKREEDLRSVQKESQQAWPQLTNDEAQRNPEENRSLKKERIPQPLPKSPRRLPPTRNTGLAEDKTDELKKKREEARRKQQEAAPNKRHEDWRSEQEKNLQTLLESPRRLPFMRSTALRKLKANEATRKRAENDRPKQEESHQTFPECPRRLSSIRNSAMRQTKTDQLEEKREEDRCIQQSALSQRKTDEAREEDSRSTQERIPKTCPESARRLPFMRSSVLHKPRANEVTRKRAEDDRSKQGESQQTLRVSESPRRLSAIRNSDMPQTKTDELEEKREEDRCQQQSALSQRQADEAQRNPEDDRSLMKERIPQPLPESPRRLSLTRNTALAEGKTEELQKKREEQKRKKQEQNQRALIFSPTRSSVLHKRVAEEDDPNQQDEDWRNVQEESQQAWPQLKNDEAQRNPEEDRSLKEERIPQPLPESPRRPPSIRNYSMRQTKLKKKRKEHNRKPQEQNQPALAFSPTRYSVLRERVAQEAARERRDEDWRKEQVRTNITLLGLPNQQDKQIPDKYNTRHSNGQSGTGLRRKSRYFFVKREAAARNNSKDTKSTLQMQVHPTLKKYPSLLSAACGTTGTKDRTVDRTELLNISELARKRLCNDHENQSNRGTTTCQTPYSAPNAPPIVVHVERKAETPEEPDKNEFVTLIAPVNLVESVGHVPLLLPGIECPRSIIRTSSTSFCRLYQPVQIPAEFSPAACLHLRGKLHNLSISRAFSKFVNLVNAINSTSNPLVDHLQFFFQFAESIQLKMYARKIRCRSKSSSTEEAEPLLFRIECYVFEDRRDYITSISMASEPLLRIGQVIPAVGRNLQFIDDVYELTNVPPIIAKGLKMALNAVEAEHLYHILGEIIYARRKPAETLIKLNFIP